MASLPKGLYGCEGSPVCEAAMASFRTAIARTVAPQSSLASLSQVFMTSSFGRDLDPDVNVTHRRATMLRRMVCKHPEIEEKVIRAANIYKAKGLEGSYEEGNSLKELQASPPPGFQERKNWRPNVAIYGPVGLLINSIHCAAATLQLDSSGFQIHQYMEVPIDILKLPWQHLSIIVEEFAMRARDRATARQRTALANHEFEIDHELLQQSLARLPQQDQAWMRLYSNLGTWNDSKLATLDESRHPVCRYCGRHEGTSCHLALHCDHFQAQRFEGDPELKKLDFEKLPAPMQLGIPVINLAADNCALWPRREEETKAGEFDIGLASKIVLKPEGRALLTKIKAEAEEEGSKLNARQVVARCKVSEPMKIHIYPKRAMRPPCHP